MPVCEWLAQRWLIGVKEDLEEHFNDRELHEGTYFHEIDLEFVRDDSGGVQKHPKYDIYYFVVTRHRLMRKFLLLGREDQCWEMDLYDQEVYYKVIISDTYNY